MPTKISKDLNTAADHKLTAQDFCQRCWDKWDAIVDSLQNDKDAMDDEVRHLDDAIQDYKQEIVALRESLAKWTKRAEDAEQKYAELVEVVALRTDQAQGHGEAHTGE